MSSKICFTHYQIMDLVKLWGQSIRGEGQFETTIRNCFKHAKIANIINEKHGTIFTHEQIARKIKYLRHLYGNVSMLKL